MYIVFNCLDEQFLKVSEIEILFLGSIPEFCFLFKLLPQRKANVDHKYANEKTK